MITTYHNISFGTQTVPEQIPVVQGDTGREIVFILTDFTIPEGATATYYVQKPSGEAIYNTATISENNIIVPLTAQSIIEVGENDMQVRVILDDDIVTSFRAILMVRPFLGIGAVESSTEMNIFDQAVEQAKEEFQTEAEAIAEEVIESIPEDYMALSNEVNDLKADFNQIVSIKNLSDYSVNNTLAWELGSLNPSTGANMSSTTRIRTVDYIDLIGVSEVKTTIGSGYKFCLYWYKSDKTLQSYTTFYTTALTFAVPTDARYLRVLVADTSDGTASTTYSQQISVAENYKIVNTIDKLDYGFENANLFSAEKETISTLMVQRYGAKAAITGLNIINGRTYSVTLTPVTPIDLESASNSINAIIYDSEMTVKIRLGGSVPTTNNVFSTAYTITFTATENINNAVLGAYIVLPRVADFKITFEIKEITVDELVYNVNGMKNNDLMPSYYKAYMGERIGTIQNLDAEIGNTGDSFIFITDVHETNSFNSPALAKYIMEKSAVGRLMYGGDYINQPTSKALAVETLQKNVAKLRVSERAVFLEGNHETNPYGTGSLTPGEVYGIINKRVERYVDTDAKNYYYIDNESQKIRYIILDTGEDGDIDATQESWVGTTASALANGWVIIFLSHMAVYTNGKDVRDNVQKYDVVDKVLTAITGINAKVACWVCGHTHKDFSYATTNFPIISVTCDANGNQASTYTSDNRDSGTINEQAFDVFHVDTDSKTVYATRIGGGQYNVITTGDLTDNDRQWSYT